MRVAVESHPIRYTFAGCCPSEGNGAVSRPVSDRRVRRSRPFWRVWSARAGPWPQAAPPSGSSPILILWMVPEGDGVEARVGRGLCRAGNVIAARRDRSAYTMHGRLLLSARQRSINGSTACAVLADGAASGGEGNVQGCAMRVICRAMIMQVDTLLRRVGIWTNWHLGVIRNTSMVCLRPPAPDGLGSRVTR